MFRFLALLALAGASACFPALAAESYDNCTGYVTSLPAVIGQSGVWCLDRNLSTGDISGIAIDIQADNVTLDCNRFGLSSPNGTRGINAANRRHITIRHCKLSRFDIGIALAGSGGGHLVEDNVVQGRYRAIHVTGTRNLVRRNRVLASGNLSSNDSYGIYAQADVLDNTVMGVSGSPFDGKVYPYGILVLGTGARVEGNRIRGLDVGTVNGGGFARGIHAAGLHNRIGNNHIVTATTSTSPMAGYGIDGAGTADTFCLGNSISGFTTGLFDCHDVGGNLVH